MAIKTEVTLNKPIAAPFIGFPFLWRGIQTGRIYLRRFNDESRARSTAAYGDLIAATEAGMGSFETTGDGYLSDKDAWEHRLQEGEFVKLSNYR